MANTVVYECENNKHILKRVGLEEFVYEKYIPESGEPVLSIKGNIPKLVADSNVPIALLYKAKKEKIFMCKDYINTSNVVKVC